MTVDMAEAADMAARAVMASLHLLLPKMVVLAAMAVLAARAVILDRGSTVRLAIEIYMGIHCRFIRQFLLLVMGVAAEPAEEAVTVETGVETGSVQVMEASEETAVAEAKAVLGLEQMVLKLQRLMEEKVIPGEAGKTANKTIAKEMI